MNENRSRSITKAFSWRVVATLTTMAVVYIVSGELVLALSIGVIEFFAKIIFYYLHERAWINVKWGKLNR